MLFDMPLLRMKSRDPTWRLILRMDDRSRPLPGSMDAVSAAPLQVCRTYTVAMPAVSVYRIIVKLSKRGVATFTDGAGGS